MSSAAQNPPTEPLVIGIAGGSGSGKTTIAEKIAASLPQERVSILTHDHYYRDHPELSYDERTQLNFDHPESLETPLLVDHLVHLRSGNPVEVPRYDFTTHRRSEKTVRQAPTAVIIVEGILVLADRDLRKQLDIKIFVDTDPDIRLFRRIRRDLEERGRSFESVRAQYYSTVRPMHLEFVEPSKRHADLIIPEGGDNKVAVDVLLARLRAV